MRDTFTETGTVYHKSRECCDTFRLLLPPAPPTKSSRASRNPRSGSGHPPAFPPRACAPIHKFSSVVFSMTSVISASRISARHCHDSRRAKTCQHASAAVDKGSIRHVSHVFAKTPRSGKCYCEVSLCYFAAAGTAAGAAASAASVSGCAAAKPCARPCSRMYLRFLYTPTVRNGTTTTAMPR